MYTQVTINTFKIMNHPLSPCQISSFSYVIPPSCPLSLGFLSLEISLNFLNFYINGVIQYLLFFFLVWDVLLCIIILRFIHVFACKSSSLFIAEQFLLLHILFMCSHVDGNVGCFQVLAVTDPMRTLVCKSLYGHMLLFLLGKYLCAEWIGHVVGVCLTLEEPAKLFSKVVIPLSLLSVLIRNG